MLEYCGVFVRKGYADDIKPQWHLWLANWGPWPFVMHTLTTIFDLLTYQWLSWMWIFKHSEYSNIEDLNLKSRDCKKRKKKIKNHPRDFLSHIQLTMHKYRCWAPQPWAERFVEQFNKQNLSFSSIYNLKITVTCTSSLGKSPKFDLILTTFTAITVCKKVNFTISILKMLKVTFKTRLLPQMLLFPYRKANLMLFICPAVPPSCLENINAKRD